MSNQPNPEQPQFAQGLRGYDRDQVDEYVATLTSWVAEWRDRAIAAEAELHQLRDQVEGLHGRLERAEGQAAVTTPESLQAAGERVGRILQSAFQAAEETRADAAAEAERLRADAAAEAEETLRQARDGAAAQLGEAQRRAEEVVEAAQVEAAGIVSEAAAQRLTAEEAVRTLLARRATVVADLARLRDDLGVVLDGHHGALTDGALPEAVLVADTGSGPADEAGRAHQVAGAGSGAGARSAQPMPDEAASPAGAEPDATLEEPDTTLEGDAGTLEGDADVTMVLPARTR